MARNEIPELVPVLSRGKHRSPHAGACFMEFASYLAGEKWSDHPRCTHPLLASLARSVNDHISDEGRARLVGWIPSVVGLKGGGPIVDLGIAVRSAATALPVAAADRQRALAAGILAAERVRASHTSRIDTSELFDDAREALSRTPHATRWANDFIAGLQVPSPKTFQRRSAPNIVRVSVAGIAEACTSENDDLLHDLLTGAIRDCMRWLGSTADDSREPGWTTPILTGSARANR